MKNIILLFTYLSCLSVFSQESYPYKRPELLVGKTVKVIPFTNFWLEHHCGYMNFHTDPKCYDIYKPCNPTSSLHEALSNREFNVTDMKEGKGYQSVLYIYKLEDTTNKEVLYYEYDPRSSRADFSFEVKGGLDLPADFYCDYVETMDINSNHIRHKAEVIGLFLLEKVTYEGKTSTELTFMSHSDNFAGKGYTIELENGYIIKNAAYPVGQYNNGARFIIHKLSKNDIKMLSESKVAKFNIGNIKGTMFGNKAQVLQGTMACIATK